jgi:hypothetical protein
METATSDEHFKALCNLVFQPPCDMEQPHYHRIAFTESFYP